MTKRSMRWKCVRLGVAMGVALTLMTIPVASAKRILGVGSAPAESIAMPNPYAGNAEAKAAGQKLYRNNCESCHGVNGGRATAPDLRSQVIQDAPPGAVFWFLTNGNLRHGMPSWSRLPEERRWQIVTYIQSLETK